MKIIRVMFMARVSTMCNMSHVMFTVDASNTLGVLSFNHFPTFVSFSFFFALSMFRTNHEITAWNRVDTVKIKRPPKRPPRCEQCVNCQ